MNKLIFKYIANKLNLSDLRSLRSLLDKTSDEALEEDMGAIWKGYSDDFSDKERVERVKERIDAQLGFNDASAGKPLSDTMPVRGKSLFTTLKKINWAAILLPVFIITSIYLYNKVYLTEKNKVIISTGLGERATINFSDGTKIIMSYNSTLVYDPVQFNEDNRKVQFVGDAYFDVGKDKDNPFIINNENFEVKVLGTKFYLQARPENHSASLALDEGKVLFTSTKKKQAQYILPGEMAELDYSSGNIILMKQTEGRNIKAWINNEIVFTDEPFNNVITSIENLYGVKIKVENKTRLQKFNGTLPTDNLEETLRVFQMIYGFEYSRKGNEITMTN